MRLSTMSVMEVTFLAGIPVKTAANPDGIGLGACTKKIFFFFLLLWAQSTAPGRPQPESARLYLVGSHLPLR